MVTTTLKGLSNYSKLYVIACNADSISQRQLNVHDMLGLDHNALQKQAESSSIQKIDLRQQLQMPEQNEDGTIKSGQIQERQCLIATPGQEIKITHVSNCRFAIISHLKQLYEILESQQENDQDDDCNGDFAWQAPVLSGCMLKWNEFNEKQKAEYFEKHSSHQLNFFLARKDLQFFTDNVVDYIQNKMQHSFMDHYLLARFASDPSSTAQMRRILKSSVAFRRLLYVEQLLAIEFGVYQDDLTLKKIAIQYAKNELNQIDQNFEQNKDFNDDRNRIINQIFDMKDKYNPWSSRFIEQYGDQSYHEYSDHEAMGGAGCGYMGGRGCQPNQDGNAIANMDAASEEGIFDNIQELEQFFESKKKELIEFKELESTKEYKETNYYKDRPWNIKTIKNHGRKSVENNGQNRNADILFCKDYLENLIAGDAKKPFISKNSIYVMPNLAMFCMAVTDLPIDFDNVKRCYPHKLESKIDDQVIISAGDNAIVFKEEIKESKNVPQSSIYVNLKYFEMGDSEQKDVKYFKINQVYQCKILVMATNSNQLPMSIVYKVPNGCIPLQKTKYTNKLNEGLHQPYEPIQSYFTFYFPEEGIYDQYPVIIYKDGKIINIPEIHKLVVKTKEIISEVKTFKDLMKLTESDEEKKQKILELLSHETIEKQMQFKQEDVMFLTNDDREFYLKLTKIFRQRNNRFKEINMNHVKSLLLDPEYKTERAELLDQIKINRFSIQKMNSDYQKIKNNIPNIFSYILRPINSPILEIDAMIMADCTEQLNHLEYHPMVNTRVFNFGKNRNEDDATLAEQRHETKDIRNVQFKETYRVFLLLCINQDFLAQNKVHLSTQIRFWLRLAYYLMIQDRIKEAFKVFGRVLKIQEQLQNQSSENEDATTSINSSIPIDYLRAYFDFMLPQDDNFKTARSIIENYKGKNTFRFKKFFTKLEIQLQEIDQQQIILLQKGLSKDEQDLINTEKNKKLIPSIQDVSVDDQTGALTIDSRNIKKFHIKYYPIDTEILFSLCPFVQKSADTFSCVKPFHQLYIEADKNKDTIVKLPEEVKNKNMIIEVASNDIEKFVQHYSNDIKVIIYEKIGDLSVYQNSTKKILSKVYVKVFVQRDDDSTFFFKDGFTDISGKFEFAKVSGSAISDKVKFKKFAILISDDKLGSTIKYADAKKLLQEAQIVN